MKSKSTKNRQMAEGMDRRIINSNNNSNINKVLRNSHVSAFHNGSPKWYETRI